MEKYKQKIGKYGEDIAAELLIKKGYNVLLRNYRCTYGEIDIIAESENYLVFVEVKTRSSKKYGVGAEAVNLEKQKHIIETALCYLSENETEKLIRFDVVEVYAQNSDGVFSFEEVNHIENAIQEASNEISDI